MKEDKDWKKFETDEHTIIKVLPPVDKIKPFPGWVFEYDPRLGREVLVPEKKPSRHVID